MADSSTRSRRIRRWALAAFVLFVGAVTIPIAAQPHYRAAAARRVMRVRWLMQDVPQSFLSLRVPFLPQEHALSCEVATLRMALAYRGVDVDEATLISAVGFDPTPRSGGVWGDPDAAFVGDIDGGMGTTGYGVHAGPIGRVAGAYRRVEVIEDGTVAMLAAAIAGGNPVITWGCAGGCRAMRWRTQSGQRVDAVNGEHTRVVFGMTGSKDAPDGFLVLDPIYGEQYWPVEKFMENWAHLGKTGVIIY
jgi:uncharacterized protein YvpB